MIFFVWLHSKKCSRKYFIVLYEKYNKKGEDEEMIYQNNYFSNFNKRFY
jgi:hypothetical protein